ncbi:MAG: lipid-transfer protein, partial [Actinomycetota bacterium]
AKNGNVLVSGSESADELLSRAVTSAPFRDHDLPAMADGVSAIIIAAGDAAKRIAKRPAWIRAIDHRIDHQNLGWRDLARSTSAAIAASEVGVHNDKVDIAELHTTFSHHEQLLINALQLRPDATRITPSGGALVGNALMAAGLSRFGHAARAIFDGTADRAVAHAQQGACLQQNIVAVLEGN